MVVVRNREARIRLEPPSASRSDRNGAKRRGEPLGVARNGGACRIVRSIRLPTATKERPANAAFVAPAVAFAFNRQIAIRPQGRISTAVMLQRWWAHIRTSQAGNANKPQWADPLAGRLSRGGKGSLRGGAEGGYPHCTCWPLDAVSWCPQQAQCPQNHRDRNLFKLRPASRMYGGIPSE